MEKKPAYEVVNPDGVAPLLLSCDHAENYLPDHLHGLGLDPHHLTRHIAYDIGAKQVASLLSSMFSAPLISANYSRLVIDLNRHLDDPTLIVTHADGVVIPGNQQLSADERNQRIEKYFNPYHNQYSDMVTSLKSTHQRPVILSIHSFTPTLNGFQRPWDFGVLWDRDEFLARQLIDNLSKIPDRVVGDNQPYHANDPRGYAQVEHAEGRNVELALLEIRQDLITDPAGQRLVAEQIYQALSSII